MAAIVIVLALVFALAVLPQMWVKKVIVRHSGERADFPGTGGEFARHILDEMQLTHVKVEETDLGDHYDPEAKVVRLSPQHLNGALALGRGHRRPRGRPRHAGRHRLPAAAGAHAAGQAGDQGERVGAVVMLAAPIVMALAKAPHLLIIEVFAGVMMLALSILMHAVTLPVEFDASFRRALPVLKAGRYLDDKDMPAAREILRAAAFTYVAAAAMSLLNVARWFRVLRI